MANWADEGLLGRRVAEARTLAGLSQGELGAEAGIERSALNKIENGARRVSAFELSEIARILNRQMDWFVTDPAPAIVARRERVGTSNRTIDRKLEDAARDVEQVDGLSNFLSYVKLVPATMPGNSEDAESLAGQVRKWMNLDGGTPVANISSESAKLGLQIFSEPLGNDAADGATVPLARGGVAVVNSSNDVGRRRLTAAHELGHYVTADEYVVDHQVLNFSDSGKEALVDRFARAFLVPARALRGFWSENLTRHSPLIVAMRAASHFRVDFATLARRLLEIGLIGESDAREVRALRPGRSDYIEHDLYVPTDFEGTSLPLGYEAAVFDLYRTGRISSERALAMLLDTCTEEDLPKRPMRSEGETWQFVSQ